MIYKIRLEANGSPSDLIQALLGAAMTLKRLSQDTSHIPRQAIKQYEIPQVKYEVSIIRKREITRRIIISSIK